MPNLTITTDEATLQWARIEAARRNTSVSKLVGEILARASKEECIYEAAMQDFFSRGPYLESAVRDDGRSWPTREELHGRLAGQ